MSIEDRDLFNEAIPALQPLPCDRWVARSCFQKAIRRGEKDLAVRALANLFLHDPKAVWRHLTIVALEDVGVANLDIIRSIVTAKRQYGGGRTTPLLWSTFADLANRMACSNHDQATCDLLLQVENGSVANEWIASESRPDFWAAILYDHKSSMHEKGTAALSFGGFIDAPFPADPYAVFEILSDHSDIAEVSALARGAWTLSRNPMALLLPIVWNVWSERLRNDIRDDALPVTHWMKGVPDYALDQFTRVGKSAIRALTLQDRELQSNLRDAGIPREQWTTVVGDLLFLIEGGPCVRRTIWEEAEALRRPARWLLGTAILGQRLEQAKVSLAGKLREMSQLRQELFLPLH
jgi:hypothetical protein